MSVIETQIHETEDERVARWRLEQLTRAGYDETAALVLADLVDVDLHLAVDLVRQGCPSDTALRILL
ncbi:MAG TPA: hypothetical protein VJ807_00845 [Gaiellaceae bacterium]|nr:hypothetical protein [Gaiellaceae bacterium]